MAMSAFFISDCSSCASSGYMQMPMLARNLVVLFDGTWKLAQLADRRPVRTRAVGEHPEGYAWLAHEYAGEDQIFVFGFSRGAYTARSCVGLIRKCGLLNDPS